MVTSYHVVTRMVTAIQLPQLPKTRPIKISKKKYGELTSIAQNQHCTLDEALDTYIEQKAEQLVIELPRDIDKIIDNCITCKVCLSYLDKSLQRHGLELLDQTGKYSNLCG